MIDPKLQLADSGYWFVANAVGFVNSAGNTYFTAKSGSRTEGELTFTEPASDKYTDIVATSIVIPAPEYTFGTSDISEATNNHCAFNINGVAAVVGSKA